MKRLLALSVLSALVVGAAAGIARADGFLVPVSDRLPIRGPWAVKEHIVRIEVDGQRAVTEVRQTFLNLTRAPLEVRYLFPVPVGAVIEGFTLIADGVKFEGRILPADQARRIYEDIVRQKKDPGLLSYSGRGLVQVSVFPIPAGGSREVVIRYEELLPRDGDRVRIVYPLDTERFSARPIEKVEVTANIRSGGTIQAVYSPTHPVRIERPSATTARAVLVEENVLPDRDLVLYYSTGAGDVGASLFSYRPVPGEPGHFLLLLSPGAVEPARTVPKDIVVILDHSGSMKGAKIAQAKEALRFVVNSLDEGDRMNLVAFSSAAEALFAGVRAATPENRDKALSFVDRLEAGGGTDIRSALVLALSHLSEEAGRQRAILFLTDGLPTVGEQDVSKIVAAATEMNRGKRDARMFVFGVGYDVNAAFLDRLVEENGGISENVRPKESVEVAVTGLYDKIRHTVLTDLALKIQGAEVFDVYPRRLPDLFAGSQLVVVGRYREGGSGAVVLAGRNADGKTAFRFPVRFEIASDPDEEPFVARIWATTKIGFLLDQMRVLGRREPELIDEVVRLSTKYGIVTEYTSFLADDSNDFRDAEANRGLAESELEKKLDQVTGGAGTNQAVNTKRLRHQQHEDQKQRWADAEGREIVVDSVRNIGRKTFYRRQGIWVDREIGEGEDVEEVVMLSPRFFDLIRGQKAAENAWLAFDEPVLVRLGGRNVRVVPAE